MLIHDHKAPTTAGFFYPSNQARETNLNHDTITIITANFGLFSKQTHQREPFTKCRQH